MEKKKEKGGAAMSLVCLPKRVYLGFGEVSSQSRGGPVEVSQLGAAGWSMQKQTRM